MVACNLQNTKKMVSGLFLLAFLLPYFECMGQDKTNKNEIELEAFFREDTVISCDSLELILKYKNNTDNSVKFYPCAIIGMTHNHNEFISYESPERVVYKLTNNCNSDSVTFIEPRGIIKCKFKINAKNAFFYKGENNILIFYHFFEKPNKKSFWNKDERKARLSLWSSIVKVYVK